MALTNHQHQFIAYGNDQEDFTKALKGFLFSFSLSIDLNCKEYATLKIR